MMKLKNSALYKQTEHNTEYLKWSDCCTHYLIQFYRQKTLENSGGNISIKYIIVSWNLTLWTNQRLQIMIL